MDHRKVRNTDLNLLVTLAALLETQNVSRAAERLDLSQPAVSHALNRLRTVFDDPILVRSGRAMIPTPKAESLREEVEEILASVEKVLTRDEVFVPDESTRTFVVATNGFAAQLLIPELNHALQNAAPNANLRVVPLQHHDMRDMLASGEVDACLISGRIDRLPESLMMRVLFQDPFVSTVRDGHPFGETVSLEDFAAASHILVSPRGDDFGVLDTTLASHGMRRRIALFLPDFIVVSDVLKRTDYVISTPLSIVELFKDRKGLRQIPMPEELRLGSGALIALWHERVHADPVNQWFRQLVSDASDIVRATFLG